MRTDLLNPDLPTILITNAAQST